jgi:hypothetical protein
MKKDKEHLCNVDLINKMMEKYNLTFDDIISNVDEDKKWLIDGKNWCDYYTLTEEEADAFQEWAINHIAKCLRLPKRTAKEEFGWWYTSYGLRIIENEEDNEDDTV